VLCKDCKLLQNICVQGALSTTDAAIACSNNLCICSRFSGACDCLRHLASPVMPLQPRTCLYRRVAQTLLKFRMYVIVMSCNTTHCIMHMTRLYQSMAFVHRAVHAVSPPACLARLRLAPLSSAPTLPTPHSGASMSAVTCRSAWTTRASRTPSSGR
jgi:hypothetical protein